MPLPVGLVEQALGQYLGLFSDCFSRPRWLHFVTVLLALRAYPRTGVRLAGSSLEEAQGYGESL
jgi:hypothetical protein